MDNQNLLNDLLDDETARQYRAFLKYQPIFKTMLDAGVFNVKNGQVMMNFNDLGRLMKIDIQIRAYNHGKFQDRDLTE